MIFYKFLFIIVICIIIIKLLLNYKENFNTKINILCCGDSHTKIFEYSNNKQHYFNFILCKVGGATAQGAVNPNSKTDALNIFTKKIKKTKSDKILIMLGEVDCGFIIWVRSKKYNISVDEQINNSINNLLKFIKNIVENNNLKNNHIIVAGAVLPTIKDNTNKKFLAGARSKVDVSLLDRTKKTIKYNNLLKYKCIEKGYNYIDITKHIIGKNNIVKNKFLNKNKYDHHLDDEQTYKLWIKELKMILNI